MQQQPLPIIQRAISHGNRIAIQSENGETTYQELVAGSESVATALLNGSDDINESRVAYLVPPGEKYVRTQWGIWQAGGVAVPLSLSATEKEIEYSLTDSAAETVVVARKLEEKIESLCMRLGIRLIVLEEIIADHTASLPSIDSNRRAMILYTSGTTSKPKGVVTTHACIQAQIESLVEAWHWQ